MGFGRREGSQAILIDVQDQPDLDTAAQVVSNGKRRQLVAGLAYGKEYGWFLSKCARSCFASSYVRDDRLVTTVRKFVGTLKFTGYTGDIILGVAPDQDESIAASTGEQDQVLEYYKRRNVQAPKVQRLPDVPLAFTRFFDYQKWLEPYDDNDLVLLSDTKDTFFQKPPFADVTDVLSNEEGGVDLMMFQEYRVHIYNQSHNRNWVRSCFGKEGLEEVKHHRVACSGTVMGTKKGVTRYLNVMLTHMDKLRKEKAG
jgi:hypothetical protein